MTTVAKAMAVLGLCIFAAGIGKAQTIQVNRDNKTIAIHASDEAKATADIAAITVGFEIFGPDDQGVYAAAGKLSQAVLAALHKAGVEDKNIESVAQGLERNTEFDEKETLDQREQRKFVFRQSWTVSVRPEMAGGVIRAAIAAGANKTGAIEWRLADSGSLQAKAAATALVKARAVAQRMADGLGVKLGPLVYASNEAPNTRVFAMRAPALKAAPPEPAPTLEIRPQTVREEATVYAVFAIE